MLVSVELARQQLRHPAGMADRAVVGGDLRVLKQLAAGRVRQIAKSKQRHLGYAIGPQPVLQQRQWCRPHAPAAENRAMALLRGSEPLPKRAERPEAVAG
ncbi:unannotated protein [freshwater metagenome]|uniref:Unannotated protein n=1 Tax=freshwater metagenome TaxID=449393 RepID=A0A6J7EML5_9ZZZZ